MEAAGRAKQVIDRDKPARMFIDVGGVGAGVYDRLVEMDYGNIVRAVNFGSAPMEPAPRDHHGKPNGGPVNRRAEMWMKSKEWPEDVAGVQIPTAIVSRPMPADLVTNATVTRGCSLRARIRCGPAASRAPMNGMRLL